MKNFIFVIFFTLMFAFNLNLKSFSQNVAEEELRSVSKVTFENYKGSYESVGHQYLRNIGNALSKVQSFAKLVTYNNYSIVRVNPKEDKFGADIIFISKNSRLKHINAFRTIVAEYLCQKYGYTFDKAYTIAVFATYYNAVYRGNTEYFRKKYSEEIFKFTSRDIGISTKYYEWPGKTEFVIPIKLGIGKEKPKLGEIGDKSVIDKVKGEIATKERKELLNIRKEEFSKEKKEIEKKEKEIKQKKEEIAKREQELNKREEELKQKEQELKQKNDSQKLEEVDKEKQKLQEEKQEIIEEKQLLEQEERKVEKVKQENEKEEKQIKEEEKEIKKEELKELIKKNPEKLVEKVEELEKKEEELKKKEEELQKIEEYVKSGKAGEKNIIGTKLYYLKKQNFEPMGHYNNHMYLVDLENQKIIKESTFTNICGFKYYVYGDGVVVIGFKTKHSYEHFLVLLDPETLEPKIIGKDNIFWRSFIEFKDDYLYAIVIINNKYYLGKFNKKLERVGISDVEVDMDTFISFYGDKIFINDKNKSITVLDSSLKKIGEIK